jgi:UDP:flavonoid glycosyltransferase YjiC (YdhE family)
MARILIGCWGSHGDIDPSIGLGVGLRRRGHDVTIATMSYFADHVRAAGLAFHPIRPDVSPTDTALVRRIMDPWRGSEFLLREIIAPAIPQMYEDLEGPARASNLLISHPLTMPLPLLGERFEIPWASTALAPMMFFSATDVPIFPPAPWLKSLERTGPWVGRFLAKSARLASRAWLQPVTDLRRRLGLPDAGSPIFEGQHSPHLVLALYSRVLGEPQPDWPANVVITGQMFHDAVHGATLPPAVARFLDEGPAPFLFTLGSSAVLTPGRFWEESIVATQRLGGRALLLVGPENRAMLDATLPSGCLAVERAPHSLVMPRAAAVIQQCGMGTLTFAMRSGVPILAVPFANDQPDNAYRAERLGVARIVTPGRYRAPRVAAALDALTHDPAVRTAVTQVAERVRAEGGVETACDALESRFRLR